MRFILIICIVFVSCSTKQDETRNTQTYIIDIDKASVENELLYSTVFSKMKTIILETSDECLISMIAKMEIYEDYIIILDPRMAKSVFVFNKEGKFIRKIGAVGAGPGEFIAPFDFTIDSRNGEIYILDFSSQKILKYDITSGKHLLTINTHRNDGCTIGRICYANDLLYTDAAFPYPSPDNYLMQALNPSSGVQKKVYFTAEYTNNGWHNINKINSAAFYNTGKQYLFNQHFMDTVVSLTPQIYPFFIIRSNKLPTQNDMGSFTNSDFNSRQEMDNIRNLSKFIEYKDFIFFQYEQGLYRKNIVFNSTTGTVHQYKRITNNLLYKARDYYRIPSFGYVAPEGLYTFYDAYGIEELIFSIKEGGCSDRLDKKEEIAKLDEDTNPVIFYFEFKD